MFDGKNWDQSFSQEDYKQILVQIRKLIGIGKEYARMQALEPIIDTKQKVSKVTQQEQHDRRLAMSHHAIKSKLMSESSGKEETVLVKYDGDGATGTDNAFGGKRVRKAGP